MKRLELPVKTQKISVVILNYNNAAFLAECLKSVLNQTYKPIEIILVDNGSSDASLDIYSNFKKEVILVRLEINKPQGYARNCGVLQTSGDFVAFLDSDDFWEPQKLSLQFPLINENFQVVYSGLTRFGEGRDEYISPKHRGDVYTLFLDPIMEAVVIGGESTAMVTKKLFLDLNGFNPNLSSTAGWDFFLRCSKSTNVDFVDSSLVNVRLHSGNVSKRKLQVISEMFSTFSSAILEAESLTKTVCLTKISLFCLYLLKDLILGPRITLPISKIHVVVLIGKLYLSSIFRIVRRQGTLDS